MPALRTRVGLGIAVITLFGSAPLAAAAERFQKAKFILQRRELEYAAAAMPGHTAGTMTVCLDTKKGRICYSSDAVYTDRNIDEDIPLGLALDSGEAVESFKKIRGILRGGKLIPGHEPRIFDEPEHFGFRRVSSHAIALVG
jgi:glyoxylase-like metal-dependent hydrolase (beta-lactamase superfamily II)